MKWKKVKHGWYSGFDNTCLNMAHLLNSFLFLFLFDIREIFGMYILVVEYSILDT